MSMTLKFTALQGECQRVRMVEFRWEMDSEHRTAGSHAVGRATEKTLWPSHGIMAKNSMETDGELSE